MSHVKFLFLSVSLASIFLTFQNCSGPNRLSNQKNQRNESLSVPNSFEVFAGESLTLTAPLEKLLDASEEDPDWSDLHIQWSYVNPRGQREVLDLEGPQIQLTNLLPEDSGTYLVQILKDEKVLSFNFRVRVFANQEQAVSTLGTFSIRYQNTLCQDDLDEGLVRVDEVSYQEAHALCQEGQIDAEIRQNRSILCSFNDSSFMSLPSTEPRRDFIAQKQTNGGDDFKDAYLLKSVGRCAALVKCRDYIQELIDKDEIATESQIRCFWGKGQRIYAFGTTPPANPQTPRNPFLRGNRDGN